MPPSSARRWGILAALWGVSTAASAYAIVPASVLTLVMAGLGVGETGASWVISVVYLGMFTLAIPAGFVVDRVGTRRGVVVANLGLVAAAAGSYLAAAADAYLLLLGTRYLAGTFLVAGWTANVDAVGGVFDEERQATAIGLLATSVVAGFAVGQFGGPVVATRYGWPATLLAFAAATLVGLAAFVPLGWSARFRATDSEVPRWAEFRTVLTDAGVWMVALLAFAAFSLNLIFNNWMPTYLTETFAVSIEEGGLFAAAFPAVGVLARGSSGFVSDRLFGTRRRPVVFGSFLVVTPVVVAVGLVDAVAVLLALLFLAGFFSQLGLALLYTYVRELVATNVAGTALAVLNAVGFFGAFAAPIFTAAVFERTDSYLAVFLVAGVVAAAGTLVAWFAPEPNA